MTDWPDKRGEHGRPWMKGLGVKSTTGRNVEKRRCRWKNRKGKRCGTWTDNANGYCHHHDPAYMERQRRRKRVN